MPNKGSSFDACLEWVDDIIRSAMDVAASVYGPEAASDPFRGLHISPQEFSGLLDRQAGLPLFAGAGTGERLDSVPLLPPGCERLVQACALDPFDIAVLLITAAPEIDLRYERLYAYLQDDVSKKRASIDLVLNLLCIDGAQKLRMRSHFLAQAPLIKHGLIELVADASYPAPPLIAHYLKLDEQVLGLLVGDSGPDRRLATACRLINPEPTGNITSDSNSTAYLLPGLVTLATQSVQGLRLSFVGPDSTEKLDAAELLAARMQCSLLQLHLAQLHATSIDFPAALRVAFRIARLKDTVIYFDEVDTLRSRDSSLITSLLMPQLAEAAGIVILDSASPLTAEHQAPADLITLVFGTSDFRRRLECWQNSLIRHGIAADEVFIDRLAERFILTPRQITTAANAAVNRARIDAAADPAKSDSPTSEDLFAAARNQTRHVLAHLATHISPSYNWGDLVLPDDTLAQLREACNHFTNRRQVLELWGFGGKLSYGKGTNILFTGPPGTGKTMAAEVLANELGLDLFRIDLASVVSKYIGETEKNLDRIFTAADDANAILFFDEADALFGKRSEVKDAHDRYANLEISYLLQKMEQYQGLTILATNLRQNMDEAFIRRLAFIIYFPFPDESLRRRIWTSIWPSTLPVDDEVDSDALAKQFKLSGGNIKNIALAAAFLAAADGRTVGWAQVQHAAQRELQKLGKGPVLPGLGQGTQP